MREGDSDREEVKKRGRSESTGVGERGGEKRESGKIGIEEGESKEQ